MEIKPLPLAGAYLITPNHLTDARGYFSRVYCADVFKEHGLVTSWIQMSAAFNHKAGQIRGMHYQAAPHSETKIIRCTQGAVYDVIIDLRENSKTYNQWYGANLTSDNGYMLYVPKGFAHGYKTLVDNTELFYMMDTAYVKESAREIIADAKYFC